MNISKNILKEIDHNIRRGFNTNVNNQLDELISLADQVREKTGLVMVIDNSTPNHYKLTVNGTSFEFSLYRDMKNALLLVLSL